VRTHIEIDRREMRIRITLDMETDEGRASARKLLEALGKIDEAAFQDDLAKIIYEA